MFERREKYRFFLCFVPFSSSIHLAIAIYISLSLSRFACVLLLLSTRSAVDTATKQEKQFFFRLLLLLIKFNLIIQNAGDLNYICYAFFCRYIRITNR